MSRKVVQIRTLDTHHCVALCDDGTIWHIFLGQTHTPSRADHVTEVSWNQLPAIPGTEYQDLTDEGD